MTALADSADPIIDEAMIAAGGLDEDDLLLQLERLGGWIGVFARRFRELRADLQGWRLGTARALADGQAHLLKRCTDAETIARNALAVGAAECARLRAEVEGGAALTDDLLGQVRDLTISCVEACTERDRYRKDFPAMSDRAAELAARVTEVEGERDALRMHERMGDESRNELRRQLDEETTWLTEIANALGDDAYQLTAVDRWENALDIAGTLRRERDAMSAELAAAIADRDTAQAELQVARERSSQSSSANLAAISHMFKHLKIARVALERIGLEVAGAQELAERLDAEATATAAKVVT